MFSVKDGELRKSTLYRVFYHWLKQHDFARLMSWTTINLIC